MKLVLADLDEALLQEASEELRAKGITTKPSSVMSRKQMRSTHWQISRLTSLVR